MREPSHESHRKLLCLLLSTASPLSEQSMGVPEIPRNRWVSQKFPAGIQPVILSDRVESHLSFVIGVFPLADPISGQVSPCAMRAKAETRTSEDCAPEIARRQSMTKNGTLLTPRATDSAMRCLTRASPS